MRTPTHSTEFRELLYPWHPWSGLRVGIHQAIERPGGVVFRCDLKASESERCLEIPAWMFDCSTRAGVHLAEAGCTEHEHEIASITGHASLRQVACYTKAANQAQLAASAMEKVKTRTPTG